MANKLDPVATQVRDAYRNGATIRLIAQAHGCSTGTVRTFLIQAGETLRSRGRPVKEKTNG